MPTSLAEGKHWLARRIMAQRPGTILDIGVGEGTYAKLLAGSRAGCRWIGVEVFEPYVAEFGLHELYDEIIVGDVRNIALPAADVVILGDVLEHMDLADAVRVWEKARRAARKAVFASMPLGHWPQGAVNGNEHERHLVDWTNELVHAELAGIFACWIGKYIGAYAALPAALPVET